MTDVRRLLLLTGVRHLSLVKGVRLTKSSSADVCVCIYVCGLLTAVRRLALGTC